MARMRRCRAAGCHKLVEMDHWYCEEHRDQEAAYIESRAKWARGHDTDYQHKYNTVTRKRTVGKREQYAYYQSRPWKELRKLVLARDGHVDQYALKAGIVKPGNVVDHIVPFEIAPELHDKASNLITCDAESHRLKTRWEQSYYGTGIGNHHTNNPVISSVEELSSIIYNR